MTYADGKITIDSSQVTESTNCTAEVVLTDSQGLSKKYSFVIRVDF